MKRHPFACIAGYIAAVPLVTIGVLIAPVIAVMHR